MASVCKSWNIQRVNASGHNKRSKLLRQIVIFQYAEDIPLTVFAVLKITHAWDRFLRRQNLATSLGDFSRTAIKRWYVDRVNSGIQLIETNTETADFNRLFGIFFVRDRNVPVLRAIL